MTTPPTSHQGLLRFVESFAAPAAPERVLWCEGSHEGRDRLSQLLVDQGTLVRIDPAKRAASFWARSGPRDAAAPTPIGSVPVRGVLDVTGLELGAAEHATLLEVHVAWVAPRARGHRSPLRHHLRRTAPCSARASASPARRPPRSQYVTVARTSPRLVSPSDPCSVATAP